LSWLLQQITPCCPRCWQGHAVDRKLTRRPLDLVNTGVTTDRSTPLNAAIMSATVLLYLIIQVRSPLG
jgi:hypothetical protein